VQSSESAKEMFARSTQTIHSQKTFVSWWILKPVLSAISIAKSTALRVAIFFFLY
jgi:hypothetical protein